MISTYEYKIFVKYTKNSALLLFSLVIAIVHTRTEWMDNTKVQVALFSLFFFFFFIQRISEEIILINTTHTHKYPSYITIMIFRIVFVHLEIENVGLFEIAHRTFETNSKQIVASEHFLLKLSYEKTFHDLCTHK